MDRPNVLLCYTDQQRWDTIRALGNELVETPNLDRLAAEGAAFDHAFVNSPVCMPSRMSMLSGRYPASLRRAANGVEMDERVPCVQHLLGAHGYATANIGKLHFLNHATRDHREPHPAFGFDTRLISDEPGCYDDAYIEWVAAHDPDAVPLCRCDTPPGWAGEPVSVHPRGPTTPYRFHGPEHLTHSAFVAEETCSYIRRHRHEPFFCVAGFYAPHPPINPPGRLVDRYDPTRMPLPARAPGENHGDVSDAQWREIRAYYYALVTHVDEQVGRILDELDTCGLRERTIVVFTSDHGEHLGDHGLVGKGDARDSAARVPLLVRYPARIEAGLRRSDIVEHVDLVPTLLDFAGVPAPRWLQGRSLRPQLEGGRGDAAPRDSALMEIRRPHGPAFKALRTRDSLYEIRRDGSERLFDMAQDPDQLHDRAAEPAYRERLEAMRRRLLERWFEVEGEEPRPTGPY